MRIVEPTRARRERRDGHLLDAEREHGALEALTLQRHRVDVAALRAREQCVGRHEQRAVQRDRRAQRLGRRSERQRALERDAHRHRAALQVNQCVVASTSSPPITRSELYGSALAVQSVTWRRSCGATGSLARDV